MDEKRTFFLGPTPKILSRPDGIILPAQIHNKATYASSLYIVVWMRGTLLLCRLQLNPDFLFSLSFFL